MRELCSPRFGELTGILSTTVIVLLLVATGCERNGRTSAPGGPERGALSGSGTESVAVDPQVVAWVSGQPITAAAFRNELLRRGGYLSGRFDDLAEKRAVLDDMIRFKGLVLEARRAGFDQDPEIVGTVEKMIVQKLLQDQILKELGITPSL